MNSDKKLHIISFDNPFPPNYGGVIDVFYKIKHLHAIGVKIILHVFEYGRTPHEELNQYCEEVHYYKRKKIVNPLPGFPYIVITRSSKHLLHRLLQDDAPILFEGLHTCYYLNHPKLKPRLKMVRMHNIEHDYYENLKGVETSFFKRIFFHQEAKRLRKFEGILKHADKILAISRNDATYLSSKFNHVEHVTAFHPNDHFIATPGKGDYAFYHGKLSVGENDEAARFLVDKVFRHTSYPLYIAGYNPSPELRKLISTVPNVSLFDNLSTEQITGMIGNAQINILPTFQATGIKLKLINVLYQGRFVLVNRTMVSNTGCEPFCSVANTPEIFIENINQLAQLTFTQHDIDFRKKELSKLFDNHENAVKLFKLIFGQTLES